MQYHIARNGQTLGEYPEDELRAKLQSGYFIPSDLCWTEGMSGWQPLGATLSDAAAPSQVFNPYSPPSVDVSSTLSPSASGMAMASLWRRLVAVLLNLVAMMVCFVPLIAGAVMLDQDGGSQAVGMVLVGVGCLAFLAFIVYNAVLLATRGQTLGKMWMKIRIVDSTTGENPGFAKAVLVRYIVNDIVLGQIPLYGLVDACFIFREDRRCIHDLMAGTQVVAVPADS